MKLHQLIFISAAMSPFASALEFEKPFQLMKGDEALYISGAKNYVSPAFHDFDKDGKVDLVLGLYSSGKMRKFRNIGETGKPNYKSDGYIKTAGKSAVVKGVW